MFQTAELTVHLKLATLSYIKVYENVVSNKLCDEVLKIHNYNFFHLRKYAYIDAKNINGEAKLFHIQNNEFSLVVPLIIRKLPKSLMSSNELVYDGISPYGNPGILFKSFIVISS